MRGEFAALGIELEVLVPAQLPRVRGDGSRVEQALVRLLQERLSTARESPAVTLTARPVGRGDARSIVISICDAPAADGRAMADPTEPIPAIVTEIVRELGGEIRTVADPLMGRTTAIRLDVSPRSAGALQPRASGLIHCVAGGLPMSPARSVKRVCLSYSGGLDTSVILRWLIERYRCEVVTFTADIGQEEELSGVPEKARATGAVDCVVRDVREEFVRDYVFPALRGNAVYEGHYLLGTALARPLIAKHQAEVARATGCDAVAHGATGKGNDQVRFELAFRALAPELTVIAPWREWDLRSRTDCIAYAQKHSIPITVTLKKPYSTDRNLMHISYEGGILEDPWRAPDEDMFILTRSPERAPDEPVELVIGFEQGTPVTLDGESLTPARLLAKLNRVAGAHGVGRVDMVENRFVGLKSRGVYETPGGSVLHVAHRAVESITMDRDVMHERDRLSPRFAEMIYNGFWFAPEMEFVRAAIEASQRGVTGEARVRLYKGSVRVTGRRSPVSLYSEALSTFEDAGPADTYDPADAAGFIRLQGLRLSRRERD